MHVVNRLHRLLTELVAGGAKRPVRGAGASGLAGPAGDTVGATRRGLAVEQVGELAAVDGKLKALEAVLPPRSPSLDPG